MIGIIQRFAVALDVGVPDLLNLLGYSFERDHWLSDIWTLTLPQVAPLIPYLMLVVILIFRPRGLMGNREA